MASFEIPLAGTPERFTITLNGTQYQLTIQWRDGVGSGWFLDIADPAANIILAGVALVTGADLLAQHHYLGIAGGAALYVTNSAGGDAAPTYDNLGTDTHLILVTG